MLVLTAALAKVTSRPSARLPSAAAAPSDQNTTTLAREHQQQAPDHRPLAQPRGLPAQLEQAPAARAEALDDPAGQPEEPQLLGGRRVDREPVGVVRVALRLAHFLGVAVAPDGALAQQPVRGEPGAGEQAAAPTTRSRRARPPRRDRPPSPPARRR